MRLRFKGMAYLLLLGLVLFIGAQTAYGGAAGSLKWKFNTGHRIGSSPAIGPGGTIYMGSDDNCLYALNPNGTLKWKFKTGDMVHSPPTVGSDGTIYVGSCDGNLYALNPNGTLKWKFKTGDCIDSSPSISLDGTIYVGSYDHYLYALNPNGTLKWKFKTGYRITSSPAINPDGTIYVGSYDHYLYAINPNGTLKWKFETGNEILSSPSIDSDGTIYIGSVDHYLYAINPNGTLKWKFETGDAVTSSPSIGSDGTIYVGSYDHYLYALNPNGTLKWKFKTGYYVISSPAIGSDGTIYVGSYDHYLYALNPNGTLQWKFKTGDQILFSPVIKSDGTIYVGSFDGYLYSIYSNSHDLANSPWPMFLHDIRHTGRTGANGGSSETNFLGTVSGVTKARMHEDGFVFHGPSYKANDFYVELAIKPDENNSTQQKIASNFCNYTKSYVVVGNNTVAHEIDCQSLKGLDVAYKTKAHTYDIGFELGNSKTYFRDGTIKICKKNDNNTCYTLRGLPKFSVYGTQFNVVRDGFSFKNGYWDNSSSPISEYTLGEITNEIAMYLTYDKIQDFFNDVGSKPKASEIIGTGNGMCYGMALVAAGNFNLRNQDKAWGMHKTFKKDEWASDIMNHWDNYKAQANEPYKPLAKNTGNYVCKFHAVKKIAYYFVAQPYFNNYDLGKTWVGKDEFYCTKSIEDIKNRIENILVKEQVAVLPFLYNIYNEKGEQIQAGHTVNVVQLIEVGKYTKFVVYDNNHPNVLEDFVFDESSLKDNYNDLYYYFPPKDKYMAGNTYGPINKICTLTKEPLHAIPALYDTNRSLRALRMRSPDNENTVKQMNYPFTHHIEVYLVGGTFNSVTTLNGENVPLVPVVDKVKEGVAYREESNAFRNIILLPVDKTYQVTVKKNPNFPFLTVFATVPYDNGTVEFITYDHAELSDNGTTYATFNVGRNVKDKTMYRTGGSERAASYSPFTPSGDSEYAMQLSPLSGLQGVVTSDGIQLSWHNPQNPNFSEVKIMRSVDNPVNSPDNGTLVYEGTDETTVDTPDNMSKTYCYAAFAIDKNGSATEPDTICINAYKYTLYGYIKDQAGNPIAGATVTLYNGDGSSMIASVYTDHQGLYTINGLLDGTYKLSFSDPSYTFDNDNITVEMHSSKEVDVTAKGKPVITMDFPQSAEYGNTYTVIWNGENIGNNEDILIELLYKGKWYTIAKVPYKNKSYSWKVSIPESNTRSVRDTNDNNTNGEVATLRVGLDNTTYAEKQILIRGAPTNNTSGTNNGAGTPNPSTSASSGGGGGGGGCTVSNSPSVGLLLILLTVIGFGIRRRFKER